VPISCVKQLLPRNWAPSHTPRVKTPLLFLITSVLLVAPARGADLPQTTHPFVVIAHRGDRLAAHENTLTAFRKAAEAGIDFVEIDVRRTADDHYVLMHDSTVDRMTDGRGKVSELTLEIIRGLKVRDTRRPQIPPDRVPTFEEVLATIKGKVNVYLDFKAGDRATVTKMIRDAGVTRQILIYDEVESIPEWHQVAPELPLIVSPPESIKTPAGLVEFVKQSRVEVLDGSWDFYTKEMVEAAQAGGARVWPDIQDGRENAEYFAKVMARGFSGAQSDHPHDLIEWLKSQNRR
jgi:glycerophosphoryl diester phosphodiesterase